MDAKTKIVILTMTIVTFSVVAVTATIIFQESVFAAGGPPTRSVTPTPPTGTHQAPTPAIATPPAPTPIIRNSTSGNATSGNTTK